MLDQVLKENPCHGARILKWFAPGFHDNQWMREFLVSTCSRFKVQIARSTDRAMKTSQGRFVRFALALAALPVDSYFIQLAEAASWSTNSPMIAARQNHTATLMPNGKVLVVGGRYNSGRVTQSAELYDRVTGSWSLTGAMNTARERHTATLLSNGKVLVTGGYGGGGSRVSAEL